ncbi:MAG: archease [Desulfobacteraceae bacterium]|nr:MAG: archease [Desulfobacteraceae bacterium]
MPYQYLEEIATADVAFKAWGESPQAMILAAGDATMQVMVEDLEAISEHLTRTFAVQAESMEMLLFDILQEIIYYKDADQLLLRLKNISIQEQNGSFAAAVEARGEKLDPTKHALNADVKAVTLHRFCVQQTAHGWEATVVLDI